MTDMVVYIDRSDVHEGHWDELKAGIRALVAFVDREQPQMVTYGFYLDEDARQMTVVAVHPDSASLERHVQIGGPEFKKLAPFIELRGIEVFGDLSESAVELLQQKAAALGDRGVVTMHEQFTGFDRIGAG
jgi:quinol monooxygenase YgiN